MNCPRLPRTTGIILCPGPSIPLPPASGHWFSQCSPCCPPAGPRYDTRTIVWICLTLITGLVTLLLLLICKKRWVAMAPATLSRCLACGASCLALPGAGGRAHRCTCSPLLLLGRDTFLL